MNWKKILLGVADTAVRQSSPLLGGLAVEATTALSVKIRERIDKQVLKEIEDATRDLIKDAHKEVVSTVALQNGILFLSLLPVYLLHSPIPFYLAYAGVLSHSFYGIYRHRRLCSSIVRTRSITQTLASVIREQVEERLKERNPFERKAVEWLGSDLNILAEKGARKIRPQVVAAVWNMIFTIFVSYAAFRVFAIPLLERHALGG